jgi:pilus assembly protein CpaE
MLRAITVGADEELTRALAEVFAGTGRFGLLRSVGDYPNQGVLERILRAHAPQVVFLCVDSLAEACQVTEGIEKTVPGAPVVAFGRDAGQQVLLELMKMGVREFLPLPFQPVQVFELADRIEAHLDRNPLEIDSTDLMFSFLPAKPGVGTSTLAINLSVAFSRLPDTKVLLTDFDLNSGLIAFMLKLNAPYTTVDAVVRSEDLDENLWPQLVAEMGNLHMLPCGRSEPGIRIEPIQINRMLTFARRQYRVICADLSGNMEKYSIELMMESKRIFLVTTPEIPPIHLARERMNFLRDLDLEDRVSVLLNRWDKKCSVTIPQIENLLEVPVFESFPNSYAEVHRALVAASPVEESSEIGKSCATLARRILTPGVPPPTEMKKRFFESFSILSSKYSLSR